MKQEVDIKQQPKLLTTYTSPSDLYKATFEINPRSFNDKKNVLMERVMKWFGLGKTISYLSVAGLQ